MAEQPSTDAFAPDDLASLPELNDAAVLHGVRARFASNKIYTQINNLLIAMNPYQQLPIYNAEMMAQYKIGTTQDGWNKDCNGEEFYYISNPALGLWAVPERFEDSTTAASDDDQQATNVASLDQQTAVDGSGGVGGWAKPPSSS